MFKYVLNTIFNKYDFFQINFRFDKISKMSYFIVYFR